MEEIVAGSKENEVQYLSISGGASNEVQRVRMRSALPLTGAGTDVSEVHVLTCTASGGVLRLSLTDAFTGSVSTSTVLVVDKDFSPHADGGSDLSGYVETALESMTGIVQSVRVVTTPGQRRLCYPSSSGAGNRIEITFLATKDPIRGAVGQLELNTDGLLGGDAWVETTTPGLAHFWGGFTLAYDGDVSSELFVGSDVSDVASALASLPSLGGEVLVSLEDGRAAEGIRDWLVTFVGRPGDLVLLTVDDSSVAGGKGGSGARVEITEVVAGSTAVEVQVLNTRADVGGTISSGTFTLSLLRDGGGELGVESTSALAFDVEATELQAALHAAVPSAGVVTVMRTGPDTEGGYSWAITFLTKPRGVPELVPSIMTPFDAFWSEPGGVGQVSVHTSVPPRPSLGGTFTVSIRGETTTPISFDASTQELKEALEAGLSAVRDLRVSKGALTADRGSTWGITFPATAGAISSMNCAQGESDRFDLCLLVVDGSSLSGHDVAVAVRRETSGRLPTSFNISRHLPSVPREGLAQGTQYFMRAWARTPIGWSRPSNVASNWPRTLPGPPAAVALVPGDVDPEHSLKVIWEAPKDAGGAPLTGYRLRWHERPPSREVRRLTVIHSGVQSEQEIAVSVGDNPGVEEHLVAITGDYRGETLTVTLAVETDGAGPEPLVGSFRLVYCGRQDEGGSGGESQCEATALIPAGATSEELLSRLVAIADFSHAGPIDVTRERIVAAQTTAGRRQDGFRWEISFDPCFGNVGALQIDSLLVEAASDPPPLFLRVNAFVNVAVEGAMVRGGFQLGICSDGYGSELSGPVAFHTTDADFALSLEASLELVSNATVTRSPYRAWSTAGGALCRSVLICFPLALVRL